MATSTGRWNSETTLEALRADLGLETTRGWTEATVLRVAPCRFGRDTVVAAWSVPLPTRYRVGVLIAGVGKQDVTCSDALTAVRRWLGVAGVLVIPGPGTAFAKLSRPFQQLLRAGLAPAA